MKSYRNILPNLALLIGIAFCAATAEANQTWSGKVEITADVSDYLSVASTDDAAVYQTGYVVSNMTAYGIFGDNGHNLAYILESGTLTGLQCFQADGGYLNFRQMGGMARFNGMRRTKSTLDTLPFDLVFGGSAYAHMPLYSTDSILFRNCHMNIAVMDDADVDLGLLRADGFGTNYVHIVALNGGKLTMSTREGSRNVYFAFNGGTLQPLDGAGGAYIFGESKVTAAKYDPWIRVYEKGGRVIHRSKGTGDNQYVRPPPICEPVDNVVWSILVMN